MLTWCKDGKRICWTCRLSAMLGLGYWILCLPDQKKYNKIQEAQVLIHFLVRPASQSKQHFTSSRILSLFRDYNLISGDLTWYHVLQDSDPEANHFLPQRQVCPCLRHAGMLLLYYISGYLMPFVSPSKVQCLCLPFTSYLSRWIDAFVYQIFLT